MNKVDLMHTYSEILPGVKVLKRLTVIFLCTPLFFLLAPAETIFSYKIEGICLKVLDGDTIIVNKQKIRLAYIDAPESHQNSYDKIPIGQMSKEFLEALILNKTVYISYKERGKYGRIIGRVWIKVKQEELDINLAIIKNGQAVLYGWDVPLNYKAQEYIAKISRRGIFGVAGFDMPFYFRKKEAHKWTP